MPNILNEVEKSILQVLISKGLISDSDYEEYVNIIVTDYQKRDSSFVLLSREEIFRRINSNIREYGFEIKTVIERKDDDHHHIDIYYHGIVNTEEDFVAKSYGANGLDSAEIKFFSDLATKLVAVGYYSTWDIEKKSGAKPVSWNSSQVGLVLDKLMERKWLRRDHKNRWILGLRSFLELRLFLEGVVGHMDENDDDMQEVHPLTLEDFPQLIVY